MFGVWSVALISNDVHKWRSKLAKNARALCCILRKDRTLYVINADIYTHTHTLINSSELFIHEWWASDGSDLITPVVCPRIAYSPPPCPFLLSPRQSISLWKWHFKRLIALWPSLSDSDRWQAGSGVMVLHVSHISQHGSWSQHTRWICCSICCHRMIFGSLQTGNGRLVTFSSFFFCQWSEISLGYVVLVEEWSYHHCTAKTTHMHRQETKKKSVSSKCIVVEIHFGNYIGQHLCSRRQNLLFFCQESSPCTLLSPAVFYCHKILPRNIILQSVLILTPIITLPLLFSSLLLNKVAVKMGPIFILTMTAEVCSWLRGADDEEGMQESLAVLSLKPASVTSPMVTGDLSAPPVSNSSPTEPPRGRPPARIRCFPLQKQPGLGPCMQPAWPWGSWELWSMEGYLSRGKAHLEVQWAAWERGNKCPLELLEGEWGQSSQPSLFPYWLHTPRGMSHDQTMESGTRSKDSIKTHTHTHFSVRDIMSPALQLNSHIHI